MAARNFKPGHFYRLQNFETHAPMVGETRLLSEGVALIGIKSHQEDILSFVVVEKGASTRIFSILKEGDPICVMGPTGVRSKIPHDGETILIIGGQMASAHLRAIGQSLRECGNRVLFIGIFDTAKDIVFKEALEEAADAIFWITKKGPAVDSHRPQDLAATGDFIELLLDCAQIAASQPGHPFLFSAIQRVHIVGTHRLVKIMQSARKNVLKNVFHPETSFIASIYGPMQCMLKGVCAQCLQWQLDPKTGRRTKAVFCCSWQEQPLDIVDLHNLDERLEQNQMQEILSNLWLDYLLADHDVARI